MDRRDGAVGGQQAPVQRCCVTWQRFGPFCPPVCVTFTITHLTRRIPMLVSAAVRPLGALLVVLLFSLQVILHILHILHILPFKGCGVLWQKCLTQSLSLRTGGRNVPTSNRRLKKQLFWSVVVTKLSSENGTTLLILNGQEVVLPTEMLSLACTKSLNAYGVHTATNECMAG